MEFSNFYFTRIETMLIPLGVWGIFLAIFQFGFPYVKKVYLNKWLDKQRADRWYSMIEWLFAFTAASSLIFIFTVGLLIFFMFLSTAIHWVGWQFFGWTTILGTEIKEIDVFAGVFSIIMLIAIVYFLFAGIKKYRQIKNGGKKHD